MKVCFTAKELKVTDFTILDLKSAGYTVNECKGAGWSSKDIYAGGQGYPEHMIQAAGMYDYK